MKVRYGFVTNSSSSSFILNFKSKHSVREELEEENFTPDMIEYLARMIHDEGTRLSKAEYIGVVTRELEETIKFDQYMARSDRGLDAKWADPLEGEFAERFQRELNRLKEAVTEGSYTVVVDVEDHTDEGAALEHDILPHAKHTVAYFSHH